MAPAPVAGGILRVAARRHRAGRHEPPAQRTSARNFRVRGLRTRTLSIAMEVRFRHRLAELLPRDRDQYRREIGFLAARRAHRSALRAMSRAPRARLPCRAAADGAALLHGRRGAAVYARLTANAARASAASHFP